MKAATDLTHKHAVTCKVTGIIWYFESKAEAKEYERKNHTRKYIGKTS